VPRLIKLDAISRLLKIGLDPDQFLLSRVGSLFDPVVM
jgi:hypothetical protein